MELRPGRGRQGQGRSWKRRAFTKNLPGAAVSAAGGMNKFGVIAGNYATGRDLGGFFYRLLSEKCKRRSGALNPWSCGQGGFGRVTADLGNVAPSPRIFGKLATFFFSEM